MQIRGAQRLRKKKCSSRVTNSREPHISMKEREFYELILIHLYLYDIYSRSEKLFYGCRGGGGTSLKQKQSASLSLILYPLTKNEALTSH